MISRWLSDAWTLTLPFLTVALVVLAVVTVALCVSCVRQLLSGGLVVRLHHTAGPDSDDLRGWRLETVGIGSQSDGGTSWQQVQATWPDAAAWASQTSRRPDVRAAWVDLISQDGVSTWVWEAGMQTLRTEARHG